MKKITLIFPLLIFVNCILMDRAGLAYPKRVSGREAKDTIVTNAILGSAASGSLGILPFFAADLANVNPDRYYLKSDVDDCARITLLINLSGTDIGGITCDLQPDAVIFPFVL
ncbi:lipoprotein [Leptospira perolatii]|uniref:Lipoprotein n=1 Tax=Leptospira perolatii TaxID=2023191 RepID=A0A2M9ZPG8_9LEPT|nr:TIGR04452 family lipoprotein [Leptospira perolatii]PJZ70611.1 lipoprotein [Leptospira perolatii]PJZ73823.1 lipoprotein [Leptospira perolatii]